MQHKKVLGTWRLTALVIGNMVGSGIFLLPASLAAIGSISILSWILTSIGAICIALVFARLAGAFPKVGGPYAYCHDGLGNFMGFQVAYNYWIYIWVGNAAIVISFVGYLGYFFPSLSHSHQLSFVVATTVLWLVTIINIKGVREAGMLQLLTVILKLLPLIIVATVGLAFIQPENFQVFNVSHHSTVSALGAAALLTLWSLTGVESATVPAADVINPRKTIPRATVWGTLISSALYVLGTIAVMGVVPMHQLAQSSAPFSDAAQLMFGKVGAIIVTCAALLSTLGAINGWILLQGQVPFAAAKDKLFHRAFARESSNGTPYFSLIISSALITILLFFSSGSLVSIFTFMILLATMATLFVYLFSCIAEIKLMIKKPESFSGGILKRDIIICLLAIAYIIWTIIGSGWQMILYGLLLFLTGIPFYLWMCFHHRSPQTSKKAA